MRFAYSFVILLVFFSRGRSQAQMPFQKLYQSETSIESMGAVAANGDYLLATDSYGGITSFDHRIICQRLDSAGQLIQSTTLQRGASFRLSGLMASSDNGMLITGRLQEILGSADTLFIAKLDAQGAVAWAHSLNLSAEAHEPRGVLELSDGSLVFYGLYETASFSSSIFLAKFSSQGVSQWTRIISSQMMGAFLKVGGLVETHTGDLILSGSTRFNSEGSWLAKLSSSGMLQSVSLWRSHMLTRSQAEPFALYQQSNGELDVFFNNTSFNSETVMMSVHTDANGVPSKVTRHNINHTQGGGIVSINPSGDGGYLGCGYHFPNGFRASGLALKIDGNYNTLWSASYGTDYIELLESIHPTPDGGVLIAGFADPDSMIISPGENGLFPWLIKGGANGSTTCFRSNMPLNQSDTMMTTEVYQLAETAGPNWQSTSFFTDSLVGPAIDVVCMPSALEALPAKEFEVYPNPAEAWVQVEFPIEAPCDLIEIRNIQGQLIRSLPIQGNSSQISLEGLPQQLYLLTFYQKHRYLGSKPLIKR